jgi:hypothetical protein
MNKSQPNLTLASLGVDASWFKSGKSPNSKVHILTLNGKNSLKTILNGLYVVIDQLIKSR